MDDDVWNHGLRKNMPQHFKTYYKLWQTGPQEHIHSRPKLVNFEKDEWGEIHPVQNPRVYVIYPEAFHEGLWGGEGVIKGMLKRESGNHRNFTPPAAKYWWPKLYEGVLHSEILGKHIDFVVTKRGLRLVDEAAGLDNYLLSTPVNEIYATGLLRIKRELLLSLSQPDKLRSSVYHKYQRFSLPWDEADWHGLTLEEAKEKQAAIEEMEKLSQQIPDKVKFRKELVEMLQSGELEQEEEELIGLKEKDQGMLSSIKNVFTKS